MHRLVTWSVFVVRGARGSDAAAVENMFLLTGAIKNAGAEWDTKIFTNLNYFGDNLAKNF